MQFIISQDVQGWGSVINIYLHLIKNLDTPERKRWWNNPVLKTIWLILSFFLGFFAVCLLIVFFAFFGCCYEFVKCYINRKPDHDENDIELQREEFHNQIAEVNNQQEPHEPHEVVEVDKCKENSIIALLIFLGILCQPLYLLFYLLYAMMECYRRFSCWFYYVDYWKIIDSKFSDSIFIFNFFINFILFSSYLSYMWIYINLDI